MGTWKLIVYPFGLAILGMIVVDVVGVAFFGVDGHAWLEWQNQVVSAAGTVCGLAGAVGGVYLAIRSHARLIR